MQTPAPGTPLPPAHPSTEALSLLATRRSAPAKAMTEPGPSPDQLDELLAIAARVPDHRAMAPFRFVVFEGEGRAAFGDVLKRAGEASEAVGAKKGAKTADLFERAPTCVAVISRVDPNHKTPEWEQVLTAGAVCQNLLIAASAAGFAGQWLTGWSAYDDTVHAALGMDEAERVAGWIFLGTSPAEPTERERPALAEIATRYAS